METEFFERSSLEVAKQLSERIYIIDTPKSLFPCGEAKILVIESEDRFKITLAEAYSEEDTTGIWSGKRADRIRALEPGSVVAFRYRSAILPFIKTKGVENILLHGLEDLETHQQFKNPTQVSGILGLTHDQVGSLSFIDHESLLFKKYILPD